MEKKLFSFYGGGASGHIRNAAKTDGALRLAQDGLWISHALDSGEEGTRWDKAELSFEAPGNGFIRFTAVSSDEDSIDIGGKRYPVGSVLRAVTNGAEAPLDGISAVSFVDPRTAPLHTLKGRFLWFMIEGFPEKGGNISVSGVKILCPHVSLMSALPEVFAKDDNGTLMSLLAVYKEVFDRLDREITGFGKRLDPDTAAGADLERLLSWQGIEVSEIWGEDKLRRLVKASSRLICLKGTRAALSELFEILLGEAPAITENRAELSFTVETEYSLVPSERHRAELLSLLSDFTPAGITSRLILRNAGARGSGWTLTDDGFGSGFII